MMDGMMEVFSDRNVAYKRIADLECQLAGMKEATLKEVKALGMCIEDLQRQLVKAEEEPRRIKSRTREAMIILEGYDNGEYGEQGDFNPHPVRQAIIFLKSILMGDSAVLNPRRRQAGKVK